MNYFILIVGFILLIKGADIFVDGSSAIAKKIGIPSVIVGLTIVSLGTSAPEMAVNIISSIEGSNEITLGNILGSNIFNSLVVLGGTALVTPLIFKKSTVKRDYIIDILVTIIVFILIFGFMKGNDFKLSRVDGIALLGMCIAYIITLIVVSKNQKVMEDRARDEINVLNKIFLLILGIAGIIFGGKLVVNSATSIAYSLGMSEKLVGLTIVAIGTSLPELVTSIVAALKGERDIALGNVLGSNIFNLLLILGASSVISPIPVGRALAFDFIFLIFSTLFIGILIFMNEKEEKKITRLEGAILVFIYIFYLFYIIIRN